MTRHEAALRALHEAYRLRETEPDVPRDSQQLRQKAIEFLHQSLRIPQLECTALVDEVLRDVALE